MMISTTHAIIIIALLILGMVLAASIAFEKGLKLGLAVKMIQTQANTINDIIGATKGEKDD